MLHMTNDTFPSTPKSTFPHACDRVRLSMGEITIKGAKGLVDNQFFMYHVYFENVSHITFK